MTAQHTDVFPDQAAPASMDRRARDVVLAATARARELGVAVSVVVVDASGGLVSALRMDGAPWFTPDVARLKARTSAALDIDTDRTGDLKAAEPELFAQIDAQVPFALSTLAGGVVVHEGGQVMAAVGVSGAPTAQDVDCARVGAGAF